VFSNNISRSTSRGFQIQGSSQYNSFTDNTVFSSSLYGFAMGASSYNTISNNTIRDSGAGTTNNAILLDNSDNNLIVGNSITDSSATTNNYGINISNSTSDANYLADNTLNGSSINDAGTGTVYGGQLDGSGNFE